ncbi:MAG: E2/UBC family protein [Actinomycetota bacterium]
MRASDEQYLDESGLTWSAYQDGEMVNLIIEDWPVPGGLEPETTALLIRLPATFNAAAPDMFWCDPPVVGPNGAAPAATQVRNEFDGRTWQRWSRHIGAAWRPGIDNVASYLGYVAQAMAQAAQAAA